MKSTLPPDCFGLALSFALFSHPDRNLGIPRAVFWRCGLSCSHKRAIFSSYSTFTLSNNPTYASSFSALRTNSPPLHGNGAHPVSLVEEEEGWLLSDSKASSGALATILLSLVIFSLVLLSLIFFQGGIDLFRKGVLIFLSIG